MHPNPAFRQTATAEAITMARARSFGTLSVNGPDGPLAAHIPFDLAPDGGTALLHLARSNPIARAALPAPALLAVSGPDAYVSPDWYGADDQVPTWNYTAVHLRGLLEPLPPEALLPHLDAVSAHMEGQLAPKTPWTTAKMTPGAMERLMRMILPFRLVIRTIDSTVKLNQNKTVAQRAGAAAGIAATPLGLDAAGIAALMQRE
jgi:transcriptional regulator